MLNRRNLIVDGKKQCTGCGERKLLCEFTARANRPAGVVSRCKPCMVVYQLSKRDREAHAKYRADHRRLRPDLVKATTKRYLERHPQVVENNKKRIKEWCRENPERAKQASANYNKAHPEVLRRAMAKRRAKLRAVPNAGISAGLYQLLMQEQGGKCPYCAASLIEVGFNFDHYIPVNRGGANEDWNIQLACPSCNKKKSDKDPLTFLKEIWRAPCELMGV
jgi:5-methylcytosine-specific restriction endonuclease McrA